MANIKSAKKRIKVNETKRLENKSKKSEVKTYIKKFETALENNEIDQAKELLQVVDQKLKKAVSKNIIHKNNAARKLSSLTKRLNEKAN